ncbi:GNAT family N-acetyltransferase [Haloprofundus marisrubri]|uniref:GNAT family N-acetyltransferase n=1 Tax=Haloprofundus marisrubri TaxID=1514971 RepID=UPI0012BAF603|nr:GNAT family N-acetyltransferase [Haloprofundus marisrubri]
MEFRRLTNHKSVCEGIDCWNQTHPSFAIDDRLVSQNVFAPYDNLDVTAWGAFENDSLLASAICKRLSAPVPSYLDTNAGWISLFVVDEHTENRDEIARSLLAKAEEDLTQQGVTHLRVGGDPQQFLAGLPSRDIEFELYRRVIEEAGYTSETVVTDLHREIADFDAESFRISVDASLSVKRVRRDPTELLSFLSEEFPGRWQYEAENICRVPGGSTDYWLLEYQDKTVGFARTNTVGSAYRGGNVNWASAFEGSVCGLGPLGIHSDYRGRGWGLWMLATILSRFQNMGYTHALIDWTELVEYYGKLGFEPWLDYTVFTKEVSA